MTTPRRTQADALRTATAVGPPRLRHRPDGPPRAPVGGLYDPRFEHDSCGVALVADLHGRRSHTLVRQAVSALEHLAHRGATGSEEDSGDGAGILIQVPHDFYVDAVGFELPSRGHYATGIAFLSRDPDEAADARRSVGKLAGEEGFEVLGWRTVPVRDRLTGFDLRGGHAVDAPALRGPLGGHLAQRLRPGAGHRPPGLRAPQADRARDRQLLLRLPVGPDHHLQGDAHLPPADRLLPRPVRRTGDERPGPGPLPLLHQHLPVLAAGPSLPVPGPQRGDQHAGRQPQLDAGPRGPVPVRPDSRARAGLPHRDPGGQRLGLLRRGARAPPPGRPSAPPRRADDDPRGVGEPPHHGPGPPGLLPLPRRPDGALGRPRRGGLHRRHGDRRRPRPQRPPAGPVLGHRRRTGGAGQRGRRPRGAGGQGGAQGAPAAGADVPGGHRARPDGRRRRDQGCPGRRAALRRMAGRRPDRARGPAPAHHAHPPARLGHRASAPLRLHQRGAAAHPPAHGQNRERAQRLDGDRHGHRRALRPAPAPLRLLHPTVRPGHQPSAGRHPRGAGHLADVHARPRGQPARTHRRLVPPDRPAHARHRQRRPGQAALRQRGRQHARLQRLRHRRAVRGLGRGRGPAGRHRERAGPGQRGHRRRSRRDRALGPQLDGHVGPDPVAPVGGRRPSPPGPEQDPDPGRPGHRVGRRP